MATFLKRDAAKLAAQQARAEGERIVRDYSDTAEKLGTLTVDEETATLWLDGEIGPVVWGCVDAVSVRDAMRTLKGRQVTFRINSGGGGVDEGLEIYTILKEHRGGLVTRANLAASMAGIVFQAGNQRVMEPTGTLMIHGPRLTAGGDASEHIRHANKLAKYAERVVPIFASRSGQSENTIRTLLERETWYTPAEAVSEGFADEVATPKRYPKAVKARAKLASVMCRSDAIVASYADR